MKDLQELFESLGHDEMMDLAGVMDKKNLNPHTTKKVLDYVASVYCHEMGVDSADVTEEEVTKLCESFCFSATIYANILNGHMEIKSGRIRLTDGSSCSIALTPEGIKHVEGNLLK